MTAPITTIFSKGHASLLPADLRPIHPVAESLSIDGEPLANPYEPHAFPVSARNSKTICTARSRSSAGCGFLDTMSPAFPEVTAPKEPEAVHLDLETR
jgi:hypothetical protein